MKWRLALGLAAWAGCAASPPPPPPGTPITVTPGSYDASTMALTDLPSGAPIDLVFPPQGGFVLFVGARVHNLTDGVAELRGRLLDPSGAIVAEDARTVTMKRDGADPNLWAPDLRSYTNVSNITVCPSQSASDRAGVPFTLEVVVTEASGRSGKMSQPTMTVCRQADPAQLTLCKCECAGGFFLGKCM